MQPFLNRTCSFYKRMLQCTLPDNGHSPVKSLEGIHVSSVALDVSLELLPPEVAIRSRHGRESATVMSMPETAMDEYHSPVLREHDVRGARKFPDMESIPESSREKNGAESPFRPSVLSSDARHHAAALWSRWYTHDLDRVISGCAEKRPLCDGVLRKPIR